MLTGFWCSACGVEAVFPEWSGSVASGVYARNKFSAEECMARHVALVARIAEVRGWCRACACSVALLLLYILCVAVQLGCVPLNGASSCSKTDGRQHNVLDCVWVVGTTSGS